MFTVLDDDEDREHLQLLLDVARLYYIDGCGQAEIAARISFSRPTVSRLLAEARERRVVRFVVGHPLEREMDLEERLQQRYGLRGARVVTPVQGLTALSSVAMAACQIIAEACRTAMVLAVSAGSTISAVVDELPTHVNRDLMVVQMIGMLSHANTLDDSPDIVRRVAERLGCSYRLMPAPLIVASQRLARALRKEVTISTSLALASHADVALVGIGAVDARGSSGRIFQDWLTDAERRLVHDLGAIGHVSGHHFDHRGQHLRTPLCSRVMAVDIDRLDSIGEVIGVATGPEKVQAIRAAARGQLIDVLVTDTATATAVLA